MTSERDGSTTLEATKPADVDASTSVEASKRKRYEPPRVIFRERLEALAATCTPSPPAKTNPGICPRGPISS
jgi:hypothetical protein